MNPKIKCSGDFCYIDDNLEKKSYKCNIPLPRNGWTVYGTKTCGYCQKTHNLFSKLNIPFVFYDINDIGGKNFVIHNLKLKNHNTIPIIYNNNEFLGGYTQLEEFLN